MGMSAFYGPGDDEESIATIHRALELGITFLDTAELYGRGANEELVGRAIKGKRDRFVLATKFIGTFSDRRPDGRPEYIRQAIGGSNLSTIPSSAPALATASASRTTNLLPFSSVSAPSQAVFS